MVRVLLSSTQVGIILHSSKFTGVVGTTVVMVALEAHEVIRNLTSLVAILAVVVAYGMLIRSRHGLHTHRSVQHRKVLLHIFDALFAKRARVRPTTPVHAKA